MPTAILQSDFSSSSVDGSVIRGCKLMEVNRMAHFKSADGQQRSIYITPSLVTGLLNLAGNRSIPSHLKHDWHGGDGLEARLGAFKNVSLDAGGNLVADLHTMPNENGKLALWLAENDPANAAFSAIFAYNPLKQGDKTIAVPLDFQSADLVSKGAAVSAMFSQTQETDMTKEEIQALIKEGVTAALADYKPEAPKLPDNLVTKETLEAALASHKPTISKEDKEEVAMLAAAASSKQIGETGGFASFEKAKSEQDEFTAKLGEYRKSAPNEATAIARLLKDHPSLAEARDAHAQTAILAARS